MTVKEILEVDFYDLCGIGALFMTDQQKIKYWNEIVESNYDLPMDWEPNYNTETPEERRDKAIEQQKLK